MSENIDAYAIGPSYDLEELRLRIECLKERRLEIEQETLHLNRILKQAERSKERMKHLKEKRLKIEDEMQNLQSILNQFETVKKISSS